jgi:hypothetical protein
MEWLVTFKKHVAADDIHRVLAGSGAEAEDAPPIPLGDDEQVVSARGPADLPRRLEADARVVSVHPNSEMTLY